MKNKNEPQEVIPEENKLAPITAIEADIVRMKQQYEGLSISGADDKDGFNKVSTARKDVKKRATDVEKIRKSLVDDAVKWQKQVNSAAKIITEKLEEIRRPLEVMENGYLLAVENKKLEAERLRQEKIQSRAQKLLDLKARFTGISFVLGEITISQSAIERISDEDFASELALMTQESEAILAKEKAEKEAAAAEKLRLQQEAAKLKLEQDQLKKDREELGALLAKLQIQSGSLWPGQKAVVSEDPYKAIAAEAEEKITVVHEKPKISFEEMIANPVGGAKRVAEKAPEIIGEAISEPDWIGPDDQDIFEGIEWFGPDEDYGVFKDGFESGVRWAIEWYKNQK